MIAKFEMSQNIHTYDSIDFALFEPGLPFDNGAWSGLLKDWTRRSAA